MPPLEVRSQLSILRGLTRSHIRRQPFTHIVVEDCLPSSLYAELSNSFPSDETILRMERGAGHNAARPNSRHDVGAGCILNDPESFTPSWRDFVGYHVSHGFFQEFIDLLGEEILAAYPDLERRIGRALFDWKTGVLNDPAARDCQLALDCHIGINTPSNRRGSVRRVHTDAPDELFAALIYFRAPEDQAGGGDLEILRWKEGKSRRFVGSEVLEADAELCHTVITRPNTAVIFINSPEALHAVTPRSPSQVSRRLVNIMGRMPNSIPEGLFQKRQRSGVTSLGLRAMQRIRIAAGRFW